MVILSHRGYWKTAEEKNTHVAFQRSFQLGYGTETDLRDDRGAIVISHDPPCGGEITLREVLALHREVSPQVPLALNIKADGLQASLKALLAEFPGLDYFCFDMAIPDAMGYAREELAFFARQSEVEPVPALLEQSAGVWMDIFFEDWIEEPHVLAHLDAGRRVCLVSPDLHRRAPQPFWGRVKGWSCRHDARLLLCTDYPEEATAFFE